MLLVAACSSDEEAETASSPPSTTTSTGSSQASDSSELPERTSVAGPAVTSAAPPSADPLIVETTLGTVRGGPSVVNGVRNFLAIPYAAPPMGGNRWKPPQPHADWQRPFEATKPGAACPQPTEGVVANVTVTPEPDEDCLTLSVWSPDDAADLPVMVWFHGGSLTSGSAHQPLYIGDHLAGNGVVVVGVNYRLGALGFLATDELAAESDDGTYGNYGLADQVAALEWVRDNAASFGGDPGNVTIFGESAGGSSVCAHLASPMSAGLFHRAIIQSGGGCEWVTAGDAARRGGAEYLGEVGCDDIACMRRQPVERLVAAQGSASFTLDGHRLDTSALAQARAGTLADIPVMTGSNADEWTLFSMGAQEPSEDALRDQLGGDDVLALYPADQYDTNLKRLQAYMADSAFICPSLTFAAAAPTVYAYHYTFVSDSALAFLGATHGAELVPLFGHPEGIAALEPKLSPPVQRMSTAIQKAWVSFATTGKPGGRWPAYSEAGQVMVIDTTMQPRDEIRDGRCDALTRPRATG